MKNVIIANQLIGKSISSGGDVLAFQMVKRMSPKSTIILAPKLASKSIVETCPGTQIYSTGKINPSTASSFFGGVLTVLAYLERTIYSSAFLISHREQIQSIYLTGDFYCNVLPAYLLKHFCKKSQINIVGNFYHLNPKPVDRKGNPFLVSFFSRLLQKLSLGLMRGTLSKIFVLTEEGKKDLVNNNFDPRKIVISGAAVEVPRIKGGGQRPNTNQIAYVGRINNTKGAFDLIDILKIIKRSVPKVRCIVVGSASTEDLDKMKTLIKVNGLRPNITLTGFLDENEKYKVISQSKCLVLPSNEEGFGIVIMEALALGVPVVCFDLPAIRLIYGKYKQVYRVPLNDLTEFSNQVAKLLKSDNIKFKYDLPSWDDVYKAQSKYF